MDFINAAITASIQVIAFAPLVFWLHWIVCQDARNIAAQQAIAAQSTEAELTIEDLAPLEDFVEAMEEAMDHPTEEAAPMASITRKELLVIAKERGIKGASKLKKAELLEALA
jgi:hypothetical protein